MTTDATTDDRAADRLSGHVYWGERQAMVAEVAALDVVAAGIAPAARAAFLILAVDGGGDWDTEFAATRDEAQEIARDVARCLGYGVANI